MIRRLFSILAALSLLLGIGLGCLWERSMRVGDQLVYTRSSGQYLILATSPRQFGFMVEMFWGVPLNDHPGWDYRADPWNLTMIDSFLETMRRDSWLGFELDRRDYQDNGRGLYTTSAFIPLWFPMVLTLIAPLCWLRRWRRQARRVRLGLCLHCGYDQRASKERCPECGTPISAKAPR